MKLTGNFNSWTNELHKFSVCLKSETPNQNPKCHQGINQPSLITPLIVGGSLNSLVLSKRLLAIYYGYNNDATTWTTKKNQNNHNNNNNSNNNNNNNSFLFFFASFQIPSRLCAWRHCPYIILLCRHWSSSEFSPLVRYPFIIHLSTPHPAISPAWISSFCPCLRLFLRHHGLVTSCLQESFPGWTASFVIADAPPILHLASEPDWELKEGTVKVSASTATRLERALPASWYLGSRPSTLPVYEYLFL